MNFDTFYDNCKQKDLNSLRNQSDFSAGLPKLFVLVNDQIGEVGSDQVAWLLHQKGIVLVDTDTETLETCLIYLVNFHRASAYFFSYIAKLTLAQMRDGKPVYYRPTLTYNALGRNISGRSREDSIRLVQNSAGQIVPESELTW
jgi:hypothetical protein